ncbi:MAG: aspartyl protease family protein, partial [Bdellovibrionota bacterium]
AGSHLIKIPVKLNDTHSTYFIFDTGIGVNLISKSLCEKIKCETKTKTYKGKRMSGQELEIPLANIDSLTFAGIRQEKVEISPWDMEHGFLEDIPSLKNVEGFLSLGFFRNIPFTMDYKTGTFTIEDEAGLERRKKAGHVIPIIVEDDGTSVVIFMMLQIPGGDPIKVEIDLGGNILTLNEKYMKRMGTSATAKDVVIHKAKDETNHPFIRYFVKVPGPISPVPAPELAQRDLKVMFQKIIHDGLIANDFMKRFTVTYDLENSRLILTSN